MFAPAQIEATRVLLANEPRMYREVLFDALNWRRPLLEVGLVEPDSLDAEIARFRPHLVVCSRDRGETRDGALAWVKLYPDGENLAEVFAAGERATIVGIAFGNFLSVVDSAEFLRRPAGGGCPRP